MDAPSGIATAEPTPATASVPLFRPNKRRKVYRQRVDDTQESDVPTINQDAETIDDLIASARAQAEEKELADILRLRKQKKLRSGGVEFRVDGTTSADARAGRELTLKDEEEDRDLVKEAEAEALQRVVGRFAPQMGVMGGGGVVDRHMMSYIDSELAKRRFESGQSGQNQAQSFLDPSSTNSVTTIAAEQSKRPVGDRQPAMLGKLQEIDLGDEHREYNMSRTRKRLNGESLTSESTQTPKDPPKPRPGLGPDGKPWRLRKPRGRNSEDIRRDALVEEVLRENRIELYDEAQVFAPGKGIYKEEAEDGAADDRIAEEFKKEFMDAISQRQRKRPEKAGAKVKLTKEEELLKGPKLGGSKSQRAAMREMVLKGEIPPPRVRK